MAVSEVGVTPPTSSRAPPYAPGLHPGLPQYLSPISRMTC